MPISPAADRCFLSSPASPLVLGKALVIDLHQFPELDWLSDYLSTLASLQAECDRLTQAMQAIWQEGEVYRDCWIEPYTKTKNNKHYTYHQLRWLTGEHKPSGQPKVKTKHLSHQTVSAARAAIARGHQIAHLEAQRQQLATQIVRLRQRVQGIEKRLRHAYSQTSTVSLTETNSNQTSFRFSQESIKHESSNT